MTRVEAGKLRKGDSVPGIGKGFLSTSEVQIGCMVRSATYAVGRDDYSLAVIWPVREAVICCSVSA
jgi:hypothetical protein